LSKVLNSGSLRKKVAAVFMHVFLELSALGSLIDLGSGFTLQLLVPTQCRDCGVFISIQQPVKHLIFKKKDVFYTIQQLAIPTIQIDEKQ
jgi:hypothetical protein